MGNMKEKLYGAAFAYKKLKLWDRMWDSELFALRLSGDRTGYVSISSFDSYPTVTLYIGEESLESFYAIKELEEDFITLSLFQVDEIYMRRDCLECSFEGKDDLQEYEREEAKQYAKALGVKITGKRAYPYFLRYQPYLVSSHLRTEQEEEDLCEAISGGIWIAQAWKKLSPQLAEGKLRNQKGEIPVLKRQDAAWSLDWMALPERKKKEWPEPKVGNDISIARLKKIKKNGVYQCEIIHYPEPVQDDSEETPFFPATLLMVDASNEYILPLPVIRSYEKEFQGLLDALIHGMLENNICPAELLVKDERTYAFAKDLCGRLKIKLEQQENLDALENVEEDLYQTFGQSEAESQEQIIQLLEEMLKLDRQDLNHLPTLVKEQLRILLEQEVLPGPLKEKISQILDPKNSAKTGKKKGKQKKNVPEESYVISVSLGTGCYRHIKISNQNTLFDLHCAIIDAFDFFDDHAHAFFMDNHAWSYADCYYAEGVEDDDYGRVTSRYRLYEVGLSKGKAFKYIFDFGDEWTFQCKVLRIEEGRWGYPEVIRSKGDAPSQYGGWDEEEDWDDDEDDE